jgi:putative transposase
VSIAAIIATGVNQDGRREILGLGLGQSEAAFWIKFLRSLVRRGLKGVKLVISDAHEGLKAAITQVLSATWQRCRVLFMRSLLAHVGARNPDDVGAALKTLKERFCRKATPGQGFVSVRHFTTCPVCTFGSWSP